jgi:hypothetical protein
VRSLAPLLRGEGWGEGHFDPQILTVEVTGVSLTRRPKGAATSRRKRGEVNAGM